MRREKMNGFDGVAICLKCGYSLAELLDDIGFIATEHNRHLGRQKIPKGLYGLQTDISDFGSIQWAKGGILISKKNSFCNCFLKKNLTQALWRQRRKT